MRAGLEHLGQSVLFCVSMTFLRSPVLAIFAMMMISLVRMCGLTGCGDAVRARGDLAWSVMGGAGGLAEQEGREGAGPEKALLQVYTIPLYTILRRDCGAARGECLVVPCCPAGSSALVFSGPVATGYGGPRR